MDISKIKEKIEHELSALRGKESKDKNFCSQHTFATDAEARKAFKQAKNKLFDVNSWSRMKGINSTFILHNNLGRPVNGAVQKGYFVKIELPGIKTENWVHVAHLAETENMAEFTVHPSKKPEEKYSPGAEVKHFFAPEASSTFRIWQDGKTLYACEIGRDEYINNQGREAGTRALLNTLIAEGGWAGFQQIQWKKLTNYLVHLEE